MACVILFGVNLLSSLVAWEGCLVLDLRGWHYLCCVNDVCLDVWTSGRVFVAHQDMASAYEQHSYLEGQNASSVKWSVVCWSESEIAQKAGDCILLLLPNVLCDKKQKSDS